MFPHAADQIASIVYLPYFAYLLVVAAFQVFFTLILPALWAHIAALGLVDVALAAMVAFFIARSAARRHPTVIRRVLTALWTPTKALLRYGLLAALAYCGLVVATLLLQLAPHGLGHRILAILSLGWDILLPAAVHVLKTILLGVTLAPPLASVWPRGGAELLSNPSP